MTKAQNQNQELSADIDAVGKISRKEYENLKRRCLEFEKKNCDSILIIPCSGDKGWCEMGDRSAILYKYCICEKINANVTMSDDYDSFFLQFRIGRVRTRGFEVVKKRIRSAGLFESELEHDKCVLIKLKRKFTPKEMVQLEQEEMARQLALNAIVKVEPIDPILYQLVVELTARIHQMAFRHMDKVSSATNGQRIVSIMDGIQRDYLMFSGEYSKLSDAKRIAIWRKMLVDLNLVRLELQIIASSKIWKREKCALIGDRTIAIEDRIKRRLAHQLLTTKHKKENVKKNIQKAASAL